MTARTRTCQWCGVTSPTTTAHMLHVHDEHPETIGRGRTMSKLWSCTDVACGAENPPHAHQCHRCGRTNADVLECNLGRLYLVHWRHADGHLSTSHKMHYRSTALVLGTVSLIAGAAYDERRNEVWFDGKRIAWPEVAEVTATPAGAYRSRGVRAGVE